MLTSKDLMVGNWVLREGVPCVIKVILDKYGVSTYDSSKTWGSIYSDTCLIEDIQPIPITPEILKNNGFKEIGPDSYCPTSRYVWRDAKRNTTYVSITYYDKPVNGVKMLTEIGTHCSHDSAINAIHNCDIEFIHQLQNALRICGITLNIEL